MAVTRPEDSATDDIRGAAPSAVRQAIANRQPLPGSTEAKSRDTTVDGNEQEDESVCRGYSGVLSADSYCDSPRFVRDVLGREPLFREGRSDGEASGETAHQKEAGTGVLSPGDQESWARDPRELTQPIRHPPGVIADSSERIDQLTLPEPASLDADTALETVRDATEHVFCFDGEQQRAGASAGLTTSPGAVDAIAFSGGVDSTLLAAACPEAALYVGGFEGSHDRQAATEVAAAMGRDLRVVEFTHETLVAAIPEVVAATGRTNPMDVAIAIPLYLVGQQAAADGADTLGVGQGADELFGGYAKMADPATDSRLESNTVRGAQRELVSGLSGQLERDVLTLRAASVEPWTPFLDDRLIAAALRLPGQLLATEDRYKIALRRVADPYVPAEARDAGKKAVQYGSYVSRELDRLARQAGYKRRIDDHVGKYIRSVVDDAGVTRPSLEESS